MKKFNLKEALRRWEHHYYNHLAVEQEIRSQQRRVVDQAKEATGLNQTQLAEKVGISKSQLSDIRNGRQPLSEDIIRELCDVCGVEKVPSR